MKLRNASIAVLGLAAASCMTVQTTLPGAVGVERKQSFLVSQQEVDDAARQSYQELLGTGRQKGSLNTDQAMFNRVKAIADRIIPRTESFRRDAVQWSWDVNVMTSDEINAWCMAGGKIMVYSGLIAKLNVTDAELAAVMGHEIGHALREHTREKVSNTYVQQLALQGLAAVTGAGTGAVRLASMVSEVTFALPNSREMETEADRIGLELMARAGYDPRAAITLFRKMGQAAMDSGPSFLRTHPQSEDRARDMQAYMPRVLPLYEAASASTP
jgi:predicted Zn-dependent protease